MDSQELSRALVNALREFQDNYGGFGSSFGTGYRSGGASSDGDRLAEERDSQTKQLIDQIKSETKARKEEQYEQDTLNRLLDDEIDYREKNNIVLTAEMELRKASVEAEQQKIKQDKQLVESAEKARVAFGKLSDAVMSTEKGFSKYNDGLKTASDAVSDFVSTFGPWGMALGVAIKGLTALNTAVLKQTDAVLKQSDELAKIGAAGELTTKQILELAHQAGYTSKNMEGLFKASKSLGTDVLALGNTVNDGTKSFAKIAERNDDVLAGFRKLGFSQEEFTQAQANSVKLMVQQGQIITKEMKDRGDLAKISRSYAENLTVMSALTGQTREQMEKRLEQENAAYNVQAKQAQMAVEQMRLEERLKTATGSEREEIEKNLEALKGMRDSFTNAQAEVAEFLSPDQLKAFKEISTTGTITTESGAALNQLLGGKAIELVRGITEAKTKEEYDKNFARFQAQLGTGARTTAERFGVTAAYNEEAGRALGFTEKTTRQLMFSGRSEEELARARAEQRAKVAETAEGKGEVGEDPAQKARAFIETTERTVQIFADKAVAALNPFTEGLTLGTGALIAFNTAVAAAAAGLGAMGLAKLAGRGAAAAAASGATPGVASSLMSRFLPGALTTGGTVAAGTTGAAGAAGAAGAGAAGLAATGAAVLGAGAVGYGVGTLISKGIDKALQVGTGDKSTSLGSWIYDKIHGDPLKRGGKKEGDTTPAESIPGAAKGGVLSGPKSGYLAELHGREAVIPLDGKKIPIEFTGDASSFTSIEERQQRELEEKSIKSLDDNNSFLQKLTKSVIDLDKILKKQIELEEDDESITGQIDGTGNVPPSGNALSSASSTPSAAPSRPIARGKSFEGNKKQFTDTLYNTLLEEAKKQGLQNPEVIAKLGTAQSSIETGYGKSLAGGQNYFGIKDFSKNAQNIQRTKEFINGKEVTINDAFRQYGSMEESAADYIKFLMKNPRYAKVLQSSSPEEAAMLIQQAGYATDPRYAAKLHSIMGRIGSDAQTAQAPTVKPGAEMGGILSGPKSGYDVIMHGTEAVVPLNRPREEIAKNLDSIKETFAPQQSPATNVSSSPLPTTPAISTQDNQMVIMETFAGIISSKFDEMLEKLNEANDLAGQQLRALRV